MYGASMGVLFVVAIRSAVAYGASLLVAAALGAFFLVAAGWAVAFIVATLVLRLLASSLVRREQARLARLPFEVSGFLAVLDHEFITAHGLVLRSPSPPRSGSPPSRSWREMLGHVDRPKPPHRLAFIMRAVEAAAIVVDVEGNAPRARLCWTGSSSGSCSPSMPAMPSIASRRRRRNPESRQLGREVIVEPLAVGDHRGPIAVAPRTKWVQAGDPE
jgi:hypothetical protein